MLLCSPFRRTSSLRSLSVTSFKELAPKGSLEVCEFRVRLRSPFWDCDFLGPSLAPCPWGGNITAASGKTSAVFPQFAMGGGWATQLAFVNDSASVISGRFDIFDNSGNPMPVTLNGFNRSSYTYSIPAGGTFVLAPRDANGQSPM